MPHSDPEVRRAYQREYQRKWRAANPEKVREIQQRHDEANRSKRRAKSERYRRAHLAEYAAREARRRDLIRSLEVVPFTREQLEQRLSMFSGCWMCGGEADTIDHVKPVSKGGLHILANLRPACRLCNGVKHDRWPWPQP